MKAIKTILLTAILTLMAPAFTACTDYQDEIDALDYRVTKLEDLVKKMNLDLESMRAIAEVMETNDYITNVTENSEGYIITFNKAGAIVIKDGKDGRDGKDGKDAQIPDISVKQGEDGLWYWILNGEWITNSNGDKVRANGKDGKDGQDGKDGTDGKDGQITTGTPVTGKDGKDGKDGADGKNGNQFFTSINYEVNDDGEFMVIVTKSGQTFRIPIYKNS